MTGADAVRAFLASHDGLAEAVAMLGATLEDGSLVGGSVRDALLGFTARPKDLDVICSVSDLDRVRAEGITGFRVGLNRHDNLRLVRMDLTIDLFAPETFYSGFGTLEATLRYFDINLNAVAWPLSGEGDVIDPLNAGLGILKRRFRLIEARWHSMKDDEDRTVLLARLLKLWRRIPDFVCENCGSIDFDVNLLFARYPGVLEHHLGAAAPEDMAAELRRRLASQRA